MKLSFGLLTLIAGICLHKSCCLATASDPNIADIPDNENTRLSCTEDTTPILVGEKNFSMMHSINGTSNVPNIKPLIVGGEDAGKGEFKSQDFSAPDTIDEAKPPRRHNIGNNDRVVKAYFHTLGNVDAIIDFRSSTLFLLLLISQLLWTSLSRTLAMGGYDMDVSIKDIPFRCNFVYAFKRRVS